MDLQFVYERCDSALRYFGWFRPLIKAFFGFPAQGGHRGPFFFFHTRSTFTLKALHSCFKTCLPFESKRRSFKNAKIYIIKNIYDNENKKKYLPQNKNRHNGLINITLKGLLRCLNWL